MSAPEHQAETAAPSEPTGPTGPTSPGHPVSPEVGSPTDADGNATLPGHPTRPADDRQTADDRLAADDPTVERLADDAQPAGDPAGPDSSDEAPDAPAQKEWWDDPRMPWKGKPGRSDILCWAGFSLSGIIGLIMIPLRPILIGHNVLLLVAITGSRSGLVTSGALAAVGRADWWPIALVLGIVSSMKWDPLFWWAGKLWGRGLIDVVAGRSRWAAKNADRAERLARRFGIPAILLVYIIPLPAAVIYATVGMAGMRLRTFLAVDLLGSAVMCSLYVYLGHRLGQRAVDVVEVIARYSGYISLALLALIIGQAIWRARRKARAAA